jgi:hypothetical protein
VLCGFPDWRNMESGPRLCDCESKDMAGLQCPRCTAACSRDCSSHSHRTTWKPLWGMTWISVVGEELGNVEDPKWRLVQKQTAWAQWVQNLPEMLEPHLVEIKQQGESKLGHPEPLAHGKLLHTTLHWEKQKGCHATTRQLQTCLGDIQQNNRWAPSVTWYSPTHP